MVEYLSGCQAKHGRVSSLCYAYGRQQCPCFYLEMPDGLLTAIRNGEVGKVEEFINTQPELMLSRESRSGFGKNNIFVVSKPFYNSTLLRLFAISALHICICIFNFFSSFQFNSIRLLSFLPFYIFLEVRLLFN